VLVLAVEAYFVIGPILAVWAVVLAVIGFRRPDFPAQRGAERIVIAITGVLFLAVVLSSVIGSEKEVSHNPGDGPGQHSGRGETQNAPAEPEE
jgi:hypothetical protein